MLNAAAIFALSARREACLRARSLVDDDDDDEEGSSPPTSAPVGVVAVSEGVTGPVSPPPIPSPDSAE